MENLSKNQKRKLLILLSKMGHDSMWKIEAVKKWLLEIGIHVQIDEDKQTLLIFNQHIALAEPEWGDPGIHAPSIAYTIARLENIETNSEYTGKGFIFKDILDKLSKHWGLDEKFM